MKSWTVDGSKKDGRQIVLSHMAAGIVLCMDSANERRRYNVTSSLIAWAHNKIEPWTVETAKVEFDTSANMYWQV